MISVKKLVLVVEHNDCVRSMMSRALRTYGMDVIAFDQPDDLYHFDVRKNPISLIIYDMSSLSRMDKAVQLLNASSTVPVIFTASEPISRNVTKRISCHYNFLIKPFDFIRLIDSVWEVITY